MSFNLEEFKSSLAPFGTLNYAIVWEPGEDSEYLEFVVDQVNYLYAVSNFGTEVTNEILPYYPNLVVLSMDRIRLKGAFRKNPQ